MVEVKLPISQNFALPDTDVYVVCVPCELEKRKKTPCCYKTLEVSCGHKDRTFKLRLFADPPTRDGAYVIQVIPDTNSSDQIVAKLTANASCASGSGMPYLSFDGPPPPGGGSGSVDNRNKSIQFLAYPPGSLSKVDSLRVALLAFFGNANNQFNNYTLCVRSCDGLYDPFVVLIESFLKKKLNGTFEFGLGLDKKKNSSYKLKKDVKFETSGSMKYTIGEYSRTIEVKYGKKTDGKSAVPSVFSCLENFLGYVYNALAVFDKIEVTPPKVSFQAEIENKEHPSKYSIYYDGTISLKMEPLIGMSFTIDILEYLLKCGGPVGIALGTVKKKLESGVGDGTVKGKIAIEFKAGAEIKGGVEWQSKGQTLSSSGKIEAEIPLTLSGIISAKGKVLMISMTAYASVGAKSAVGCRYIPFSGETTPSVSFQLYCSGLKVYFEGYWEFGEETTGYDESVKDKTEYTQVIAEEWVWPKNAQKTGLVEAL